MEIDYILDWMYSSNPKAYIKAIDEDKLEMLVKHFPENLKRFGKSFFQTGPQKISGLFRPIGGVLTPNFHFIPKSGILRAIYPALCNPTLKKIREMNKKLDFLCQNSNHRKELQDFLNPWSEKLDMEVVYHDNKYWVNFANLEKSVAEYLTSNGHILFRLGEIEKNCYFSNQGLKSLERMAYSVSKGCGDSCCRLDNNQLTSLEGFPQIVGNCYLNDNLLTNLHGMPRETHGDLIVFNNQLTSLDGAPDEIFGRFWCYGNPLNNFNGMPKTGVLCFKS